MDRWGAAGAALKRFRILLSAMGCYLNLHLDKANERSGTTAIMEAVMDIDGGDRRLVCCFCVGGCGGFVVAVAGGG